VVLAACIAFTLGFSLWFAFPGSVEKLIRRIPDDSVFYFQIALKFVETHRFSYDGIHDTYGFQPLWQLVLTAIAPLFDDRVRFLQAGVLLIGVLHAVTGFLLFQLLARSCGAVAGVVAAVAWLANPPVLYWSLGGKENALYALLLVAILLHVQRRWLVPDPSRRRPSGAALGVLAGLLVLARVNALLFVGMVGAVLTIAMFVATRSERAIWARGLAVAAVAALATAGPWFLYAQRVFGGPLPTSGVVKLAMSRNYVESQWGVGWMSTGHVRRTLLDLPAYLASLSRLFGAPYRIAYVAFTVVAIAGVLRHRVKARAFRGVAAPHVAILGLLFVWGVGNAFVNLLTLPIYVEYGLWYAVPEALCVAVALGVSAQLAWSSNFLAATSRGVAAAAGALLLLVLAGAALRDSIRGDRGWVEPSTNEYMLRLGRHVAAEFPLDVRFGAWDSGVFTYFAERTVVSLEGLVSDRHFAERGRFDPAGYLRENGVAYVWGPGREFEDGSYQLAWLPRGTYEVEWLPFPGTDLWPGHWSSTYGLARIDGVDSVPVLDSALYAFGAVRPGTDASRPGPSEPQQEGPAAQPPAR